MKGAERSQGASCLNTVRDSQAGEQVGTKLYNFQHKQSKESCNFVHLAKKGRRCVPASSICQLWACLAGCFGWFLSKMFDLVVDVSHEADL